MKKIFCLLIVAFISTISMSANEAYLLEIADVLKEVESSNDPQAIGDDGLAFGILQIHEPVVEDVNKFYGTSYTHEDAMNPEIAEDIFIKYISMGIKLYTDKCGFPPTDKEIVRMWNGGIYKGYEYEATKPYLAKYLKFKERNSQTQILVSDMPKYLTRSEAVAKFKLEFLPMVREQHGESEEEYRKAWDYYKASLYKTAMITNAGLDWRFPQKELS